MVIGDSQSADLVNILVHTNIQKNTEIITRKILNECGTVYVDPWLRNEFFSRNEKIQKRLELVQICSDLMDKVLETPAIKHADIIIRNL